MQKIKEQLKKVIFGYKPYSGKLNPSVITAVGIHYIKHEGAVCQRRKIVKIGF